MYSSMATPEFLSPSTVFSLTTSSQRSFIISDSFGITRSTPCSCVSNYIDMHCQLLNLRLSILSLGTKLIAFLNIQSRDCPGPMMIPLMLLILNDLVYVCIYLVSFLPSPFISISSLNLVMTKLLQSWVSSKSTFFMPNVVRLLSSVSPILKHSILPWKCFSIYSICSSCCSAVKVFVLTWLR